MKKYNTITTTHVPRRLRQVRYENQHGLALCKSRKACPHCGNVTTSYYVECTVFDLRLYITKEEFEQLILEEFQYWPVEAIFEKFHEEGKVLCKGKLYFYKERVEGQTGPEIKTVVSMMENKKIKDLYLEDDRFRDLQDILDYNLENFIEDANSGGNIVKIQ